MVDLEWVIRRALEKGAGYADARLQERLYENIVYDNGVLREYSVNKSIGVGLRVVIDGYEGFAATNDPARESLEKMIDEAIAAAKAMRLYGRRTAMKERSPASGSVRSRYSREPFSVYHEEKLGLIIDMYKAGKAVEGVVSYVVRMGAERDRRVFYSSNGDRVEVETVLVGVLGYSVARRGEVIESFFDISSGVAGWEHYGGRDWTKYAEEIARVSVEAAEAPHVKPGVYTAVLDNEIVGLMLHEAFGHATEGDIVESGGSILVGRLGEQVASPLVTIVDDGLVEGGYWVPYDDEGTPKKRVATVEKGVLKHYLHSLSTAAVFGQEPTGNARAMSYAHQPLVRQTNTFMLPGDYGVEEMISEVRHGIYVRGKGSFGGEVNTAMGTFTFTAGPSYMIENGEIKGMVRGVMLSGNILETLRNVDAVAKDLVVHTSVFGGCGKGGQLVRVGDGGPHVRVSRITIGGG